MLEVEIKIDLNEFLRTSAMRYIKQIPEFGTRLIGLILSNLYEDCDLIQVQNFPRDFKALPGKSNFAYLFTENNLYFIDKLNNTFIFIQISKEECKLLKNSLGCASPSKPQSVYLIQERLVPNQLRKIINKVGVSPPVSYLSILNTLVIFGVFGFIPGAWTIGFPALILYGLTKKRALARMLNIQFGHIRYFMHHASDILGEKAGELFTNHLFSLLKGFGAFLLLVVMGFNSWSAVALYGIYRYTNEEWLEFCQKWFNRVYNFASNFLSKLSRDLSFNKKISLGMAIAFLLAFSSFSYNPLLLPLSILANVAVLMGFSILFKDAEYAIKNPIRVFFDNSGKLLGSLWGRWIAHRIFSGHLTGSLGPAIGYVVTPGLFSGLISSFLSPGGSFTLWGGFWEALTYRIQYLLSNILSGIFFTTEMQLQGTFFGTVGPTSLQIFVFMALGCFVGYLVERLVNRIMQNVVKDSLATLPTAAAHASTNLKQHTRELGPQLKTHIIYFTTATALLMSSPAGASLIAFANGSLIGGTMIGLCGLVLAWSTFEAAAFAIQYLKTPQDEQPLPRQEGPVQPGPRSAQQRDPASQAFTPGFRAQMEVRQRTQPTQAPINEQPGFAPSQ